MKFFIDVPLNARAPIRPGAHGRLPNHRGDRISVLGSGLLNARPQVRFFISAPLHHRNGRHA
ncbi:hypothetical protein [Xanthomonas campestris]|uniref:hypothetical protein n=1 Tax=Xanthomonas campestris TaxID=339 RepID=UPI00137B1B4B|nr:hypothetical protein [Xanthomonas campestris]